MNMFLTVVLYIGIIAAISALISGTCLIWIMLIDGIRERRAKRKYAKVIHDVEEAISGTHSIGHNRFYK
jgi:hypothetical protein